MAAKKAKLSKSAIAKKGWETRRKKIVRKPLPAWAQRAKRAAKRR